MSMNIYKSLGNIEVDYNKKEVRTEGRRIGFGMISHYEFEHVETVWKDDYDKEDSDMRAGINYDKEFMRVCGVCDELPKHKECVVNYWGNDDEVGLKLYFHYWQGGELKTSSLDFSQKDAVEARRKLKPLIIHLREWRTSDDFNMFVGEQHLRIGNMVSLNIPQSEFHLQRVELPVFGPCSICAYGTNRITHVNLATERRLSEEEMLPMLNYMKKSMPMEPCYEDNGYGVMPKPHEINLFWELPQGKVKMSWDGFNYTRGIEPNQPRDDGMDYVRIDLWNGEQLRQSKNDLGLKKVDDKVVMPEVKEDQSILGKNTSREDYAYLNDLVKAVCIDGESFDKYEKMVVKIFGDETCENLKHFIEELSRSAERKAFSNSSLISLGYLGKNAGLSQETLDAVIKHYQETFQRPEPHSFDSEQVPAQQPVHSSNALQPAKGGRVTEELRRWLKLTTICYGAALALTLMDAIYIISYFKRMNYGIRVIYPTPYWLARFLPPILSLLGLLFIRSKWLLYVEDGICRFFKGVGLWVCLLGWLCLPFFPHSYLLFSPLNTVFFGLTYLFIIGAYIFRYKMARHVKNMG